MIVWRLALRHARCRPARAILTLLGIVIGVGTVISVEVSNATTDRACQAMLTAVAGRASLEVVGVDGGRFDEAVLDAVGSVSGVETAVPLLSRDTVVYTKSGRVQVLALGVDPALEAAVRDIKLRAGEFWSTTSGAVLDADFARSRGLAVGDQIKLLTRRGVRPVEISGLVEARQSGAPGAGGLLFFSLGTAQVLFQAEGQLNAIRIVARGQFQPKELQRRIADRLPQGLTVREPGGTSQIVQETLLATRQALKLAGAFALLLAGFVILNTFLMNVSERRRQLSILRAVGATRSQVRRMLLAESLLMSLVGTSLGMLVGLGGALTLNWGLAQILQTSVPGLVLAPAAFIRATVLGLGVSWLAVLAPAWLAGRVSPLEGMGHPVRAARLGAWTTSLAGVGLALVGGAVVGACAMARLPLSVAPIAAVLLLIGLVLLLSPLLGSCSLAIEMLLRPAIPVEARLARRQVVRHPTRSALTVGVLFVAAATGIGMAGAMLDNIHDIRRWYRHALVGDFFIQAAMPAMNDPRSASMPDDVGNLLAQVPGIANIDSSRFISARAAGQEVVVIAEGYTNAELGSFDLRAGDRSTLRRRLFDGEVVIGTVLARKTGLGVGDRLPLETRQGTVHLPIAGLTNEYLVGGLVVYMQRAIAQRHLDIQGVDLYTIHAAADALGTVGEQLRDICDRHGVLLHSFGDFSRLIDRMCDGVTGCLWGILVLGFLVATMGVVNTLTMNVMEQTRELGLLRIVAMTRRQIRRMVLAQAAILGMLGLLPGALVGLALSYVMHLAMGPVTGHPVEFNFRPLLLAGSSLLGLAVVLGAAWLPARNAARCDLLRALQYE